MNQSFKPYHIIDSALEGNTALHKLQYEHEDLDIARHITNNKILNQRQLLCKIRNRNEKQDEAIDLLKKYSESVLNAKSINEIMGYEGSASRVYFPACFNYSTWKRRAPRTKCDMINALLDIGYTILFSFVESLLACYGFDLYCGVLHQNFYMRKSLVCDIVEPFRVLIDARIRKSINLKQCKEEDFIIENGRYLLKWEKNAEYVSWLAEPIMTNKMELHSYIQSYYRSFMKQKPADEYPVYVYKDEK